MKEIKITIALMAFVLLSWGAYSFFVQSPPPPKTLTAPNTFVKEITHKIDEIGKSPLNEFCDNTYKTIKYDIDVYSKAGKIDASWEENLLKNLEYAYTSVFIKQAFNVFAGSEWEPSKLSIIRSESRRLMSSYHIKDKTELQKLQKVLSQYDELSSFITKANSFAEDVFVNSYDQTFDITTTKSFIKKALALSKVTGHVSKCIRLKSQLANVPNLMYNKHLYYLINKVDFCTGEYTKFTNYNSYFSTIYKPIFAEFEEFKDCSTNDYSVDVTTAQNDINKIEADLLKDGKLARIALN